MSSAAARAAAGGVVAAAKPTPGSNKNKDAVFIAGIKMDADRLVAGAPADMATYMEGVQNASYAHVGRVRHGEKNAAGEPADNAASSADYLSILQSVLNSQVKNYNSNSQRLMDYSDMYANNAYIRHELQEDTTRSQRRISTLRNNIYISKQNNQESIYQTNRYKFMLFSLMFTTCAVLVVLAVLRLSMRELIGDSMMMFILLVLGLTYVITMITMISKNASRTRLDWTKFVWDTNPDSKLGTCARIMARQNTPPGRAPAAAPAAGPAAGPAAS